MSSDQPPKPIPPALPPKVVSLAQAPSKKPVKPICMTDVTGTGPEPIWPGYLYRGTYTLLAGDAGVGKTSVACDLMARASRGGPFPHSDVTFEPIRSLVLATEDAAETFRDRLLACAADMTKISIVRPAAHEEPIPLGEVHNAIPGYGMLFVETLEAHMPHVKGNDNGEVRRGLQPLIQALEYHRCVGLTVRHWNKVSGQKVMYRSSGAVAFTAASRTALAVSVDGKRQRYLSVTKCNLGRERPPLPFVLNQDLSIEWMPYDQEAAPGLTPEVADCVELIRGILAGGPRPAKEVKSAAVAGSIPMGVLNEAKVYLGIRPKHIGFGRGSHWEWSLPMESEAGPPIFDARTLGEEPPEWGDPG